MIDKIANKWNVLETISTTHLSEVMKVEDFNRNTFAAKVIQRDSNNRYGIYEKEVGLLKKFQHNNIVKIIDHGEDDVIFSVGYRIKSQQGTRFRIWATKRLKEYLIKGYIINKEHLEQNACELEQTL